MSRTIYIVGAPRSGSTLLGMQLGRHRDVENVGELRFLERWIAEDRDCGCGEPMRRCQFWSSTQLDERPVVVDTSKTVSWAAQRVKRGDLVVHLIRDPRALTVSRWRGWHKERGVGSPPLRFAARSTAAWTKRNLQAAVLRRRSGGLLIRYEDFARSPEGTVQMVLAAVGLDGTLEPMRAQHVVAGNGTTKRNLDAPVALDESWRTLLPRRTQLLTWALALPLSRRFRP